MLESSLERILRFIAVAEEMSFTRAAERLGVDQAWLSRQIRQLEEQLGFPLFERTTRKVALTPEGQRFQAEASSLVDVNDRINKVARLIYSELHHDLRVGVSPAYFWLPERDMLFTDFKKRFPQAQVSIKAAFTPKLINGLQSRKLDVALTTPFDASADLDYVPIHRSRPGLLIPTEMDISARQTLTLADLKGLPLAVPTARENPVAFNNQWAPLLAAGMIPHEIAEGRMAIMHYAMRERLIMLGYRSETLIGIENFVFRPVLDTPAVTEVGVARMRNDERTAVRRFWACAQSLAAEVAPLA